MSQLKTCPFCGGEAETKIWEVGNFGDREAGVTCTGCCATFSNPIDFYATPEDANLVISEAIERWNRRAEDH